MPTDNNEGRKERKHSEETKQKLREFNLGKKLSEETKRKIGLAGLGRKHSEESLQKMRGRLVSKETREKISSGNLGKKHTNEAKKKMSDGHKGRPPWNKGKKMTDEYKEIQRLSHLNPSKETRYKMRLAKLKTNPLYKEGEFVDYTYTVDWTVTLRTSIRERDHFNCQVCSRRQGDKCHPVHHIDYNKKNCNPDNLITLCVSCHMKTNTSREKWTEYFKKRGEYSGKT